MDRAASCRFASPVAFARRRSRPPYRSRQIPIHRRRRPNRRRSNFRSSSERLRSSPARPGLNASSGRQSQNDPRRTSQPALTRSRLGWRWTHPRRARRARRPQNHRTLLRSARRPHARRQSRNARWPQWPNPFRPPRRAAPPALDPSTPPIAAEALSDLIVKPPSHEYARTSFRKPEPLLRGIDAGVHSLIGRVQRRASVLDQLRIDAEKIDALHKTVGDLTDGALAKQLLDHRAIFRRGGRAAEYAVVPALAAIREAAHRTMGMRPFVVQLMGALGLHRNYLVEMATGEGKTLTAGLAAVLAGWSHHPCHIITVNDYLVQRDTEWLTPLYHMCGVRVGFVVGEMPPEKRRHAYDCDVTYTTSKEVVADFLRDSLQIGVLRDPTRRLIRRLLNNNTNRPENLVLRGLHTAIVDEADSVLTDYTVQPPIISTPL